MGNAPYHSVRKEKCPSTQMRKADVISWLESKGEVIDLTMIIHELLEIVQRLKPMYSQYKIDEIALE